MAMLAGPRRKQKVVNLRGGNSAWSDDSGKFGQRMLERMGWSQGKGLGAREDGVVTHVVARYKNDERGLGYEERSDQWTQHEDQFSKLLANLSGNGVADETSNGESVQHSGVSLEVKSKKSRARVHYHKFTRGKDLSRYSEKDLANIFGKKSLRDDDKKETKEKASTDAFSLIEEPQQTNQVFKTGGSMDEYFNSKLQALGRNAPSTLTSREHSPDHTFRGFAGASSQSDAEQTAADPPVAFSFYKDNVKETALEIRDENCDRKKKKRKRDKETATLVSASVDACEIKAGCGDECELENSQAELCERDFEPVKKKKKKSKKTVEIEVEETPEEQYEDKIVKTSKKSKRKATEDNAVLSENSLKRKKKKKDKKILNV